MKFFFVLILLHSIIVAHSSHGIYTLPNLLPTEEKKAQSEPADFLTKIFKVAQLEQLRKNAKTAAELAVTIEQRKIAEDIKRRYFEELKNTQLIDSQGAAQKLYLLLLFVATQLKAERSAPPSVFVTSEPNK